MWYETILLSESSIINTTVRTFKIKSVNIVFCRDKLKQTNKQSDELRICETENNSRIVIGLRLSLFVVFKLCSMEIALTHELIFSICYY